MISNSLPQLNYPFKYNVHKNVLQVLFELSKTGLGKKKNCIKYYNGNKKTIKCS